MRTWISTAVSAVLLAALVAGCAGASGGGSSTNQNRLSAEEIASVDVSTLYEVVYRLRPRWLEVRAPRAAFDGGPTEILVYMDRTLLGGTDELRDMGIETARYLQYLSGSEAAATLPGIGSRQVEGAIIVHTRSRD